MKSRSIDITCKTRQDTLQLYEKLRQIDFVYNIRLYESDNINVLLGWVPIPLSNEKIKRTIEENFGKVIKITEKKNKDGLLSGIRILSMNKNDLEANPLPSYIHVDDFFELYVTYPGQELTCKYCGKKGHFQAKCNKRLNDFPQLEKQSNDCVISQHKLHSDKTEFELGKERPVNLSKKRKLARTDSNVDLTNLQDEVARNYTISSDKPDCSQQFNSGNRNMQSRHGDSNNLEKDVLEKNNDIFVCDENSSNTMLQSQDQNSQDWWQICQYTCLSCKAENIIEQSTFKACCKECDEEQYVVQPCCSEKCSVERFAVRYRDNYVDCALCKSEMMRMPCCEKFQPKIKLDNNIFECVQCSKYAISCVCNAIINLPAKAISWKCKNLECPAFIVHCNCGRVTFQDLKSPYCCLCGYEYEYDVEMGINTA